MSNLYQNFLESQSAFLKCQAQKYGIVNFDTSIESQDLPILGKLLLLEMLNESIKNAIKRLDLKIEKKYF